MSDKFTDLEKKALEELSNRSYLKIDHIVNSIFGNICFPNAITNARQMLWHLECNSMIIPLCPVCQNNLSWNPDKREYRKFCSKKCNGIGTADIAKQTSIENNNGVHHTQTKEFVEKQKATSLKKYGVEHYSQTTEFKESTQNANIAKFGVNYPAQSVEIQEKMKSTTFERYGVNYPAQSIEIQEKMKSTTFERYGVDHFSSTSECRDKMKKTSIERYGVAHAKQQHISIEVLDIMNNKDLFSIFIKDKSVRELSEELNIEISTIYNYIKKYDIKNLYNARGPSYIEKEMAEFLNSIGISYEKNNRTILNGKELDFYIPKYKMAIEMNGVYWHSEEKRPDQKYHYNKWKTCHDQEIHLVSVFEDDWNFQQNKIKNMLLTHFNMKEKGVMARKTTIKQIDASLSRLFLEQYHLQGFVAGTHYGAFYNENIIGVMTFGTTRNGRFELKRFVTDNYVHAGLFSKIFKYSQKDLNFQKVVSFSDNTCFTGNVYKKNNFKFIKTIEPDYKYVVNSKRIHKSNYTKENIKKKYPYMSEMIDNNNMSEKNAMEYLGITRIWDCGKCEWVWENPLLLT